MDWPGRVWLEGGRSGMTTAPGSAMSSRDRAARRPPAGSRRCCHFPGAMEVWWIGAGGSVEAGYWYHSGSGQRYQLARPGSASTAGVIYVGVAASGRDGSVVGSARMPLYRRPSGFTTTAPGSAMSSRDRAARRPPGGITSVSRLPGAMEVWWIGVGGSVEAGYRGPQRHLATLPACAAGMGACSPPAGSRRCRGFRVRWKCGGSARMPLYRCLRLRAQRHLAALPARGARQRVHHESHHSAIADSRQHGGLVGGPGRVGPGGLLGPQRHVAALPVGRARQRIDGRWDHVGVAASGCDGGVVGRP